MITNIVRRTPIVTPAPTPLPVEVVQEWRDKQEPEVSPTECPQYSLEAEMGLLGCLLLEPEIRLASCVKRLKVGADVFWDRRHQLIYRTFAAGAGLVVDLITLAQKLKDHGELNDAGGLMYLSSLVDATPSAARIDHYIDIVLAKWQLRTLEKLSNTSAAEARDGTTNPLDLSTKLIQVASAIFSAGTIQATVKECTRTIIDRANDQREGKLPLGIAIGIRSVDRIMQGIEAEFIVVAARPGMGKTSMMCTLTRNIARAVPGFVGVISLEMTDLAVVRRMVEVESGFTFKEYDKLDDGNLRAMYAASAAIAKLPIKMHAAPGIGIDQLCAIAGGWAAEFGLSALMIDQTSKIKGTREWNFQKDRVAEVTSRLAALKPVVKCPIFLLSQLNRDAELERPTLRDLKEAGSLEEDADAVWFLWQPGGKEKRLYCATVEAEVIVAKRREGESGNAAVLFHRRCGLFCDHPLVPAQPELPL